MAAVLIVAILAVFGRVRTSRATPVYLPSSSTDRHSGSVAHCIDYTVPLTVTSQNFVFNITKFEDDFDAIDLVTEYSRKPTNIAFNPVGGIENVTAAYSISGTFCSPTVPVGREKTILLATHGLHYDRRYWDSGYKPQEYSFVEAVVGKGYSIFFYDRLKWVC